MNGILFSYAGIIRIRFLLFVWQSKESVLSLFLMERSHLRTSTPIDGANLQLIYKWINKFFFRDFPLILF
jgi:hypothetical protein